MLDRRDDVPALCHQPFAHAAALTPVQETRRRGLAEPRVASDLARSIVESQAAREAASSGRVPEPHLVSAADAPSPSQPRGADLIPILIGIALGSLGLFAAGALATILGLWR